MISSAHLDEIEDIDEVMLDFTELDSNGHLMLAATVLVVLQLENVYTCIPLQTWQGDPKLNRAHWIM